MNLAELSPGLVLIIPGLGLLLLAILGSGRRKTFRVPILDLPVPTPKSNRQKTGIGVIGLVLIGTGILLLQPALRTTPPSGSVESSHTENQSSQILKANQVLFVSSGQLQIGDTYCGSDADLICVLLYEATHPQTVTVESLDPSHSIYEVIDGRLSQNVLDERQPLFWQPPNCTHGCQRATIIRFKDNQRIRQDTINKP